MESEKINKFRYLFFVFFINCAFPDANSLSGPYVASDVNLPSLKNFVIYKINIPIVFDGYVNMLIFNVEFFVSTDTEVQILSDNMFVFTDAIITDVFDSARVLLYDNKKLTKSIAEKLRKRIWILCARKLFGINKHAKIRNLKLTSIKYMMK